MWLSAERIEELGERDKRVVNSSIQPQRQLGLYFGLGLPYATPPPFPPTLEFWISNETLFDSIHCNVICKNSGQKKWSRILLPSPYSNQSTWRIPTDQHLCGTWNKNRSKISNFTAVLKYWEFSSRMRKHTTPIQMVQATSDAITFCEKEKRKEILSERTFLFLWNTSIILRKKYFAKMRVK